MFNDYRLSDDKYHAITGKPNADLFVTYLVYTFLQTKMRPTLVSGFHRDAGLKARPVVGISGV